MKKELKDILDGLPTKPPRSRLTPYVELIDEMRERGWTYRAITRVLAEKCGVQTSPSNLHHFVRMDRSKIRLNVEKNSKDKELLPVQGQSSTLAAGTIQRIST